MGLERLRPECGFVTLHTEGVDRNFPSPLAAGTGSRVTLHTEGVDRNYASKRQIIIGSVTLHTEGVDRNTSNGNHRGAALGHPPHGGCG